MANKPDINELFEQRQREALKLLLETKHLYQSVTIKADDLKIDPSPNPHDVIRARQLNFDSHIHGHWKVADPAKREIEINERFSQHPLGAPDVKIFCHRCFRIEAFNLISLCDLSGRTEPHKVTFGTRFTQNFALAFRCQSCKGHPEIFLIRREGMKLTIEGRSPIETVAVPAEIGKAVKKLYSDAIVAFQSGQTLAANFLLRTLIEQWTRQFLAPEQKDLKADESIDLYMASLPTDFKQRFPSFRDLYNDLSADIHSAAGSSELFDDCRGKIEEHFKARKLFKLDLQKAA